MNFASDNSQDWTVRPIDESCAAVRAEFSPYLDGATTGVEMAAIAAHLDECGECATEFAALRTVQTALGSLGPAKAPARLQARLRAALIAEKAKGSHLPATERWMEIWKISVAPMALRLAGGFAAAVVLLGGAGMFLGVPTAVQANDDGMAHLVAPRYLYSYVTPQPIETQHDAAILVEAKVDTEGRVYDYAILAGPQDASAKLQVEQNLLSSVFRPATVFGVPVPGHVVMTYTGVSVRG
ncbi:MAG: zf-HC2 domain-containing protein [Acidobacteriota bacterium]